MKPGLLMVTALIFSAVTSRAQYSIDWFTIDGGGGISSGASYTLAGTVGQPDAGEMTGGPYSLVGGFWSLITAGSPSGAPQLSISLTHTNTILVSWPSTASGFTLQRNSSLAPLNWQAASQVPSDNGVTKSIVVTPTAGASFYRLVK